MTWQRTAGDPRCESALVLCVRAFSSLILLSQRACGLCHSNSCCDLDSVMFPMSLLSRWIGCASADV